MKGALYIASAVAGGAAVSCLCGSEIALAAGRRNECENEVFAPCVAARGEMKRPNLSLPAFCERMLFVVPV